MTVPGAGSVDFLATPFKFSCVTIFVIAIILRSLLMKNEDYYDD